MNLSEPLSALLGEPTVSTSLDPWSPGPLLLISHSFRDPKLSKKFGNIFARTSFRTPVIAAKSDAMMLCVLSSSRIESTCSLWQKFSIRICTTPMNSSGVTDWFWSPWTSRLQTKSCCLTILLHLTSFLAMHGDAGVNFEQFPFAIFICFWFDLLVLSSGR